MEKVLPKGWVETKIGLISEIVTGNTPSKAFSEYYGEDVLWVKPGDFHGNRVISDTEEKLSWLGLSKARQVPGGSILVTCIGNLGNVAIASKELVTNQQINSIVISHGKISNKFVYYYCLTLKKWLVDNSTSTTISMVNKSVFQSAPIIVPPLPEQERIVTRLDKFFAQHERIKKAFDHIPQLLKAFRQQVLTQAVTGKLTEEWREEKDLEEWKEVKLGDICDMKAGKFVSASEISNEIEDGSYPCYGGNGLRGYVKSYTHIGRYSLIGRQGALCGNVHSVEGQFHATEHALVVVPQPNVDDIWLFHKLTSLELINYSKGVAQPGLSVMNLNPIQITIPSFQEQQEIVHRIESLFAKADAIESSYKKLKKKIDSLPQAILNKAFKGELVSRFPTDGDAKDLLAQIKALKTGTKRSRAGRD